VRLQVFGTPNADIVVAPVVAVRIAVTESDCDRIESGECRTIGHPGQLRRGPGGRFAVSGAGLLSREPLIKMLD